MHALGNKGGCWPTPQQELLLRACLLHGKDAIAAWEQWKAAVDIDKIDPGSNRLLPQLHQNLSAQGVKDPLIQKLKGVRRLTWYRNHTSFRAMAAVLRSFRDAGIQTMILKGAALTLLHYKDYSLRYMNDFDILVRTEQAKTATDLIVSSGWVPKQKPLEPQEQSTRAYFSVRHAREYKDAADYELDLHWHVLLECCHKSADDDFWNRAVPVKVHGIPTCALNPTDQLMHVCVHGVAWDLIPPFRWVADAAMIMNTSGLEIDWNRIVGLARQHRLTLPLKDTLGYLRNLLDIPVPLPILQQIKNSPTSKAERVEYEARTYPPEQIGLALTFWLYYRRYLRLMENAGLFHKLIGFPRFLQHLSRTDHLWQVPFYAIKRILYRLGN